MKIIFDDEGNAVQIDIKGVLKQTVSFNEVELKEKEDGEFSWNAKYDDVNAFIALL